MYCILYIIFYWDGRLCHFFWRQPHYSAHHASAASMLMMIMMTWVIRVAWVRWVTKAIRVLGLTSQSVSHPISTHRLWKWKCQQYGYFVLDIEFLKALKRYSTNKHIAAWCVATLEMPSFEGAAAVGLKGRSSRKRFRQRLRKSWAAECLNYALWFQHRSDRTDVSDDEDWKLGYLTFPRSIEIWFCLLFILWQRKKLLIRIRQHLD